ncbi:MAG: phytoene desaturase family protein, partial [Flavisolibacter sp.]
MKIFKQESELSIAVVGSGISGLSAACYLAAKGYQVHVYEKNDAPGGRARQFATQNGYLFDMGPSWYWMPDVFEDFFKDFGYSVSDFYELVLLEPSFDIVFKSGSPTSIPSQSEALFRLFESTEKGSAGQLKTFLQEARFKYEMGMKKMACMPGLSLTEFFNRKIMAAAFRMHVFTSLSHYVRKYFSDPKLVALLEFPVLFLGAMPQETPAMYSLMNYAALELGTWYPKGGFGKVVKAMVQLAQSKGAVFHFNAPVEKILVNERKAYGLQIKGVTKKFDAVIAASDYQHVENVLLPEQYRNYKPEYWDKKILAPSSLIFYLGISRKIPSLQHHTLFFDEDLLQHSVEIYKSPQWPTKPLFYVCCPSKTDDSVAPAGHENLFLLMPLAVGLEDSETLREKYFEIMLDRLEKHLGQPVRP